jgi:hypothetical protein
MEIVDVKIGILRSRANRLDRASRQKIAGMIRKIEETRALLEIHTLKVLTAPRSLLTTVVDEVSRTTENLDAMLRDGFRKLSRLQPH